MRKLLARCRYFVATLLFLLTTAMSSGGAVFADTVSATSPLPYTGQGYPISQQCQANSDTPAGTMLFIFAYGGNYDPTNIVLHGINVISQQENGNEMHILTTYSNDLASLEQNVNVTWDGSVGNANLVISHGCAGTTSVQTEAPVVKHDECGTANDTFFVPTVTGVVYKVGTTVVNGETSTGGALSVTVHAYPASSAYTLTGQTEWTLTFTDTACTQTVTPGTVTFVDVCGVDDDTYTIPTTTGVVYKDATGTTLAAGLHHYTGGDTLTVHAVALTGYTLTGTTSWDLTFTNEACTTSVPTQAPVVEHDACGVDNDTFFVPTITGVVYKVGNTIVNGSTSTGGALSVTVNAYPASSAYTLTGTTTWTLQFTNVPCTPCGCNDHSVTADKPTFKDVCGVDNDKYTIPSTDHVKYYVNGSNTATPAGTYHGSGTVTIEAVADTGYTLTGDHSWSHTFTDVPCVVKVRAPRVEFKDLCDIKNDTFTIPSKTGVQYMVNGQNIAAGTYNAYDYDVNGTVTVTAVAQNGYMLKGTHHTWHHLFTNESCGGGQGGEVPVTPGTVSFSDVCATANDTYTIPATVGVVYKVNGVVTAAGTYQATGTVNITAEAQAGYALTGTANWSHVFTNEACAGGSGGQVLGESTVVFTPTAGKGAELANTGQNSLVSAIVAFVVATSAVMVYAFSPKRQLGN